MSKKLFIVALVLMLVSNHSIGQKKYKADWESLKTYEIPQWYKDAKFGIFIHWGPTTVPANNAEWYGFHMWNEGEVDALGNPSKKSSSAYNFHKENFGDPAEYGYTKFIPEFKAENFDPKEWIDLFVEAGAKYVVPVGEHCDGFAMYNSKITRWNSVEMGPKKDIVGELFSEARKQGLKVGTSSHYAYGWHWWTYKDKFETTNPELRDFYWDAHDRWEPASKEWVKNWYNRTMDMMTQYQPDLLWFDLGFCEPAYEDARKKILANYYNQGLKNDQEVVLNYKNIKWKPVPDGAAVLDLESGKLDRIRKDVWQTDMSLGGWRWGYCEPYEMRDASNYQQDLIDIVSKNGVLLLNVAPNKHGVIPDDQKAILRDIGAWLKVNGEGIYESVPFTVFGQGPSNAEMRIHANIHEKGFTSDDFRYTQNKQNIYAFWMKADDRKVISLDAFGSENRIINDAISKVSLLGYDSEITWIQQKNELVIQLPANFSSKNPPCFKIELEAMPSDIFNTKK